MFDVIMVFYIYLPSWPSINTYIICYGRCKIFCLESRSPSL